MRIERVALAILLCLGAGACARPYKGPKTLAAIGAGVLAGGAMLWVLGERGDNDTLTRIGAAGTLVGAGLAIGAGGWLAAGTACRVDPDCPEGEECKEIPAPPGREPYKQCMRR